MGVNLSQEVLGFIQQFCPGDKVSQISFIGYSLGGCIVRAALPHLHHFRSKFYAFVSLGSPHLGYLYKAGAMFNTGMWLVSSWKESTVLKQLRYTDGRNLNDCYLYRLAMSEGLDWFQHMLLVSSSQDEWVPYDSARIQISSDSAQDASRGRAYSEMVK